MLLEDDTAASAAKYVTSSLRRFKLHVRMYVFVREERKAVRGTIFCRRSHLSRLPSARSREGKLLNGRTTF